MIQGPNIQTCQVKTIQLLLELQVATTFSISLESCSCDGKSNAAATKFLHAILPLLRYCLQMRICHYVPLDGSTGKTQPLVSIDHGLGCYSTAVITAHGTNNISIPFFVYLTVSQAGVPDNIGLDGMLHPILPNHAGPLLFSALQFLLP